MVGIARQHRLDQADRFAEARLGTLLVGLPIIPRQRIHRRLGGQQRDVVVLRVIAGDGQHRVGKGAVEIGTLGVGIRRVALGQRHD